MEEVEIVKVELGLFVVLLYRTACERVIVAEVGSRWDSQRLNYTMNTVTPDFQRSHLYCPSITPENFLANQVTKAMKPVE
jgi:hypothetical protein